MFGAGNGSPIETEIGQQLTGLEEVTQLNSYPLRKLLVKTAMFLKEDKSAQFSLGRQPETICLLCKSHYPDKPYPSYTT
ncbi:hypothetical protein BTVI_130267 [Pitangus sulphuratus]|nr:hypothetical protein BTVI_130267 [Pitangus sulphuratus]